MLPLCVSFLAHPLKPSCLIEQGGVTQPHSGGNITGPIVNILCGEQDYSIYARHTSNGPVPCVPYHQYRTSGQVFDSYAYWSLSIVPEPAHRKRRLLSVIE